MMGMWVPKVVSMSEHPLLFALVQLALTLPVMYFGRRFYVNGFRALLKVHPNIDVYKRQVLLIMTLLVSFLPFVIWQKHVTDNFPNASSAKHAVSMSELDQVLTGNPVSYTHLDVYKRQSLLPASLKSFIR